MNMVCAICSPVSPPIRFLCCGGHTKGGCKQGDAAGVEEQLTAEDIDFGNFIVGPNGPEEQPPQPSFPKEMTPKEWEEHAIPLTLLPRMPILLSWEI